MASPVPSIFELTVQATEDEGEVRLTAQWRRDGELPTRRERTFGLDLDVLQGLSDAEAYGCALGRQVFTDGIRELFAQARADPRGLRVLLTVDAPALLSLRWERLAGPFEDDRWRMLGHNQRTPLSQHLSSGSDRHFPPFGRRDLRALVVLANPGPDNSYGLDPFDEGEALDGVLEGLGEIPSRVLGKDPRAEGPPTLEEICRRLTAERFTLLHVVAHGAVSPRTPGETAIFLDGDEGETLAVKASEVLRRFEDLRTTHGLPHLAFLAVCDSAKPEADGAHGGLARRLVRELGMPAVVAMTDKVSQATAFTLSRGFYARLREHGEVDRALCEACVDVRQADDLTVPALFSRLGGTPLFSDALDRPLTRAEIEAGAELLDTLLAERAPSLRESTRALAATVTVDPAVLGGQAKREFDDALVSLEQRCEEALELSFRALALGRTPPPYDARCPFVGREAFTPDEREFFFGRNASIDAALAQLDRRPRLAVVGGSGSGKSSLVMAGIVPRLRDQQPGLKVEQMRPGAHPLAALEAALRALGEATAAVLYVDGLEEAFLRCDDDDERREFFDRVLGCATEQRRVIVSMRSDFVDDCADYPDLHAFVREPPSLEPLSTDALREAIEAQGAAVGLRYETGLCTMLLEDIAEEPGAMSLLQHVLRRLHEQRHGRWLRIDAYDRLGRATAAVTQIATQVNRSLDDQDRQRLCAVMLELTDAHEAKDGSPARYHRRRVPLARLYASAAGDPDATRRLVDRLATERLLVKTHDEALGDVAEAAHESLLQDWELLQAWRVAARSTSAPPEAEPSSPPRSLPVETVDPPAATKSSRALVMGAAGLVSAALVAFFVARDPEPSPSADPTPAAPSPPQSEEPELEPDEPREPAKDLPETAPTHEPTPCTIAFVEARDGRVQPITDIERVAVTWGSTKHEATASDTEGTFTISCDDHRGTSGRYRVTRGGATTTIEFESMTAAESILWPDAEEIVETPSAEGGSNSRPTARRTKCQDHDLTRRAIQNVLAGRGCTRATVEVRDGTLRVPSLGISGRTLSSRALSRCKGVIQCPD